MKTGGDKIEGEIDTLLDKIVMLFSYLSDKVKIQKYCVSPADTDTVVQFVCMLFFLYRASFL
jgi:hypothetical protein